MPDLDDYYACIFDWLWYYCDCVLILFLQCYCWCCVWLQKFPNEGLVNVVTNVFDFDTYNKELREIVTETLHKHGIPIGANPRNVQLAKE